MDSKGSIWRQRLFGFCRMSALGVFLLIVTFIAVHSLSVTAWSELAKNRFMQTVTLVKQPLLQNLVLTVSMLFAVLLVRWGIERFARVHLSVALSIVWIAAAMFWVYATGVMQRVDSDWVLIAARGFAVNDYSVLEDIYFHKYTYQLYISFWFELVARLLPWLDLNLTIQCINAVLSMAGMGVMAALCEVLGGKSSRYAAIALYLSFLPMLFFCTFVYNVQLMLLLCSGAFLCFALYVRRHRAGYAVASVVLIALATISKLNAVVPMIALVICAVLHALANRDRFMLGCAGLSVALSLLLTWGVVAQYEWRSGVMMEPDVSFRTRLTMGLQTDSPIAPGWFNAYTEQFFDPSITPEEEAAAVTADLTARLSEMANDPAGTMAFFHDKCLTQWLEPSHEIFWYELCSPRNGRYNGLYKMVLLEDRTLHMVFLLLMAAHQRLIYLFAIVGTVRTLRQRGDAATLILPVTVLGGFLYHMLFEAKAQYIYVYVFYMMPLAAQGLCAVEDTVRRVFIRRKKAA